METTGPKASILHHFSTIPDPRVSSRSKHPIQNIFFITLCAAICGADNWCEVELFGNSKREWFERFLNLKAGIPSHDTFGRVFAAIDTQAFKQCFSQWVADLAELANGEVIAIDGKAIRRSLDKASRRSAIHVVSAWACQNQLVLGQEKVDEKSNEITAIPRLLERLDLAGCVVTLDAMGCQYDIAEKILEKKANYLLSLKGNQGNLNDDVRTFFAAPVTPVDSSCHVDAGHGRIEVRSVRSTCDIGWLRDRHPHWKGLRSLVEVTCERTTSKGTSSESRYFISSLDGTSPENLGHIVRAHWGIENKLHWVLDMAFDEDRNRTREGNSAANYSTIRHIALNLLKQDKSLKASIKGKRLNAGWNHEYLLKVSDVKSASSPDTRSPPQ